MRGDLVAIAAAALAALLAPSVEARTARRPGRATAVRSVGRQVASRAGSAVGLPSVRKLSPSFSDDCSGFVRWVYAREGVQLHATPGRSSSLAAALYRTAAATRALRKTARPGDLVFFRDTYDRDGDGRLGDGITHVGVVERVHADGSLTFVHRSRKGIVRSHLDPRHPKIHRFAGKVRNDFLRRGGRGGRGYVAGELLAGFASADLMARAGRRG